MFFLKDHDTSTNLPSSKQITVYVAQLELPPENWTVTEATI